jgi:hypothetical protein
MKKLLFMLVILLAAGTAWATTYYKHPSGSAADKAAAEGPCTTTANCMSPSVYAGETFADGDVIVHCHTPVGIPGKIWSESFINASQTLSIPAVVSYALLETGDKILLETGDKLLLQ